MTTALPPSLIALAQAAAAALLGHRLFTALFVVLGGAEAERVHSSDPDAYPLTGRKRMGPTPWGDHVLRQGHAWRGSTAEDIRSAFPDPALIASLGCAASINIPVREAGEVIGTLNIHDAAGAYAAADVAVTQVIAGFLPGALRRAASLAGGAQPD